MGLAPYAEPKYVEIIKNNLVDIKDDSSFRLNLSYFDYVGGFTMIKDEKFSELFNGPRRAAEAEITIREMDLARSVQVITEEILLKTARYAKKIIDTENLCLAAGVALNCVANGKIISENIFKNVWIQPAAGDDGGALGAALSFYYNHLGMGRNINISDSMEGAYLGPEFSDEEIREFLEIESYPYTEFNTQEELTRYIAENIARGNVVGLFHGRMEFGPRALGNRSIIGDPRSPEMQSVMNLKIKYRESFRPFAPSVLKEKASTFFEIDDDSPYMLIVTPVKGERLSRQGVNRERVSMKEWVNAVRSDIPAVTHVDYSARGHTVDRQINSFYHSVINEFEKLTGYGVIINTSFYVRGEPIVCNPEDAYKCFMRTKMDILVLNSFVLKKEHQPKSDEIDDWQNEFELD